jgi:hypothetical protein
MHVAEIGIRKFKDLQKRRAKKARRMKRQAEYHFTSNDKYRYMDDTSHGIAVVYRPATCMTRNAEDGPAHPRLD